MNKTLAFLGAAFLASACSGGMNPDAGTSSGGGTSGGTSTGGTTGTPMPVARLRVAALSPNLQAFDYCLGPTSCDAGASCYIGPILAGKSAYGGLSFPSVSDYSSFNPEAYTLAFVPPGALDCTLPDAGFPQPTTLPGLDGGTSYTVALMGLSGALTISTFTDDTSTTEPAILRFIPAKLGTPALDMEAGTTFNPTVSNVGFATIPAMTSNIDANGYVNLQDAGTFTLSFSVHGSSSPLLVAPGVTLTGGSYSSVFTIPPPTGYSGTQSAFVCFDSQQPAHGLASCIAFPVP
jgi:hypothetical protein